MAVHRQIDDVYQWELSIPPASAAALLSAVCVYLGSPKPRFWGHLLWGPKSWTIRFDGNNFELRSFNRGNLYTTFGLPYGSIITTKAGCRIELRRNGDEQLRQLLKWFPIVFSAVIAVWLSFAAPPSFPIWIRIVGTLTIVGWFTFAFRWLMPWMARTAYTDFIDDLFADYIVSSSEAKPEPAPTPVQAAAK